MYLICCLAAACAVLACKKFLDKQPDDSLQIPNTVAAYQSILDQDVLTERCTPGLGPMGVPDYIVDSSAQQSMDSLSIGVYTWQPMVYQGKTNLSWTQPYDAVFICNSVLAGLPELQITDSADRSSYNFVYGQALFLRSFYFYHLEETFGQPWRSVTAASASGIVLRTSAVPQLLVKRATVQEVYRQITADLEQAVRLLPISVQYANRNRPSRPAAYALLSKVWLTQQDSMKGKLYADSSLLLYDSLLDYNTLNGAAEHPFPQTGNSEILFQCSAFNYPLQYAKSSLVDSVLYNSYDTDDLRRTIFFHPAASGRGVYFKGQYTGLAYLSSAICTDDVYLIRAECNARMGNIAQAMTDLNTLLSRRWRKGSFHTNVAGNREQALSLVLGERRKETLFREGRWYDLRRLDLPNTLNRTIRGQVYTLPPDDARYTWLIPQQEINLDHIMQNPG